MSEKISPWLNELILKYNAGIGHLFILWGNINDLQRNIRGEYLTLYQYLAEIFEQKDLVMFYSLSLGLQFANTDMEKLFRNRMSSELPPSRAMGTNIATQSEAKRFQQNAVVKTSFSQLIGESPIQILQYLERTLTEGRIESPKCALIIDYAQNIVPKQTGANNPGDRVTAEILERFAKDDRIKAAGNIIVLLSPSLAELNECFSASQADAIAIRIPKPDETLRTTRWSYITNQNGAKIDEGLTPEFVGLITSGLSLKQIDSICLLARERDIPITPSLIKEKKQEILRAEFGERIKVKVPSWGFDFFGGKENLKQYMLEIRDNIAKGMLRRAPMGILASGPPGTGKTFFFECWAYECGYNFVEIINPRSKWVGESEQITERIFTALDDLAPVIVVEDEADQSETSRDSPNGDTGVSNRLRQMKFIFTSDPKRRGKIIWIRISNRADLIDTAYKREGRSDDTIPFLMPEPDEYKQIFEVMFKRYEIPTDITDFSSFANEVAAKIYCTGASVEWMVLEADKYAGREGTDLVQAQHLRQAIADWEMKLDPAEIDHQTILAILGSCRRLRPKNWETVLSEAKCRLDGVKSDQEPSVFPGLSKTPIKI